MEIKVLDKKQALKKAALERLKQPFELVKLSGTGDFELYARPESVQETNEREKLREEIKEKYTNYKNERLISLYLLDENGNAYFDFKNEDDMILLHNIPVRILSSWETEAVGITVSDNILKNLLPTDNQP